MSTKLLRNREAQQSRIPKPPTRRSIFNVRYDRKQTMNASYITPIMCKKVVPGQSLFLNMDTFIRLNTQLTCPIDNLQIETFFFYAPERIAWENSKYFMGEVKDPNASQQPSYITPQIEIPAEKNTAGSLFNLLSASRINKKVKVSAIPFRIHNMIYNEYFRDSDCETPKKIDISDADGDINDYDLYRIHKSRDYFTNSTRDISAGEPVKIPIGTTAPVVGNGNAIGFTDGGSIASLYSITPGGIGNGFCKMAFNESSPVKRGTVYTSAEGTNLNALAVSSQPQLSGLIADLTNAQGAALDALRQAIMTEEYLEAINRGGNKYVDIMKNIYGVTIPDLTIQRPLYLGGTSKPFYTNPVVQTSGTGTEGQNTPQGNIAGYGTGGDSGRIINCSFQEFGYVIGYMVIKAQPQYQQGLDRQWTEKDKLEYFNPFFNNASDQPIYKEEIFVEDYDKNNSLGTPVNKEVFGYIGRNDHMRYWKNEVAGELNSEYQYTLDIWHYAEKFENAPENNEEFMHDKTYEILDRTMAVIWEDKNKTIKAPQFIVDIAYSGANTIPVPVKAVPKISALIS